MHSSFQMDTAPARSRLLKSAPTGAAAILALGIALQMATMANSAFKPLHRSGLAENAGVTADRRGTGSDVVDLKRLLDAHLFGVNPASQGGAAAEGSGPGGKLLLAGVVAVGDPSLGWAFLGEQPRGVALYRAGSEIGIGTGATLRGVYADRVEIERNGILQTLYIDWATTGPAAAAATPAVAGNRPVTAPGARGRSLGRVLNLQAPPRNGKQPGIRVFPASGLKGMKEFLRLGLQPGDVITSMNGAAVLGSRADMDALRTAGQVAVTVRRGGKEVNLTLTPPG